MSKPILALNSIRGKSGKDTLIEHLEASGLKVHRAAFGDSLKAACAEALAGGRSHASSIVLRWLHGSEKDTEMPGLAINLLPDSPYKEWVGGLQVSLTAPRTPRWHVQKFGNEFTRDFLGKPNHWLDQGILDVLNGLSNPAVDVVVVTDMRQPNEYAALDAINAYRLRIVRNWHIPEVDTVPYHQSDIALMAHPFDAIVVNEWGKPEDMLTSIKEYLP